MPRKQTHLLSSLNVERLRYHGKEKYYNDGGGLYLAVRKNDSKEWLFRYTSPITTIRRKQSIGTFPDTSLKQARQFASEKRNQLSAGFDPIYEADKQRITHAEQLAEQKRLNANIIERVFEQFKKEELQNRKDKGNETERAFKKDVFPLIGQKVISQVTRVDIKTILNRPLKRKRKRMANVLLSDLKQFFGYADDEELITNDPTRRLIKDRVGGKEATRKRHLKQDEITLLQSKIPEAELEAKYIHGLWILLATGCRVNELQRAKKKDFDFEKATFLVPDIHAKNKQKHTIYLSAFASKHIHALLHENTTAWLFSGKNQKGPVSRQTITKQFTDRQEINKKIKGRTSHSLSLVLPGGRWTSHDLRRTAASLMQDLDVMPHVIKKCLNQRPGDKMEETYQRAEMADKQKDAFNKLGLLLEALMHANNI